MARIPPAVLALPFTLLAAAIISAKKKRAAEASAGGGGGIPGSSVIVYKPQPTTPGAGQTPGGGTPGGMPGGGVAPGPGGGTPGGGTVDWQGTIARAIASNNAATMRAVAAQLRAAGLTQQAADLEQVATQLEANAGIDDRARGDAGRVVAPLPGESTGPARSPLYQAADDLTRYLKTTSRYKENKGKVEAWQTLCGLKVDGLYGVSAALAVADAGVIPVAPFYWPKKAADVKAAKAKYRERMIELARVDPSRASAWMNAASEIANS